MTGYYSFYNAGRFPSDSEDYIMFTCYSPDRQPGQCTSVPESKAGEHREALVRAGYKPLPR